MEFKKSLYFPAILAACHNPVVSVGDLPSLVDTASLDTGAAVMAVFSSESRADSCEPFYEVTGELSVNVRGNYGAFLCSDFVDCNTSSARVLLASFSLEDGASVWRQTDSNYSSWTDLGDSFETSLYVPPGEKTGRVSMGVHIQGHFLYMQSGRFNVCQYSEPPVPPLAGLTPFNLSIDLSCNWMEVVIDSEGNVAFDGCEVAYGWSAPGSN